VISPNGSSFPLFPNYKKEDPFYFQEFKKTKNKKQKNRKNR